MKKVTKICVACDRKYTMRVDDGEEYCPTCEPREVPADLIYRSKRKRLEIE